ncbi:MAG TPA: tail fiber domain-containing protein [Candidatus Udaeobacter sp.]|nr:tail fiber domain-containing protein [Candidatus Udaeobacter sp.]
MKGQSYPQTRSCLLACSWLCRSQHPRLILLGAASAWFGLSLPVIATCRQGCSSSNTYLGDEALVDNLGVQNTAVGDLALTNNTSGEFNTAVGGYVLASNTTGEGDTAVGYGALFSNTADANTAVGAYALFAHTIYSGNTAIGYEALYTGGKWNNTAIGAYALYSAGSIAEENTAIGFTTLAVNTSGSFNVATGNEALGNNISGSNNTATGYETLVSNQTGNENTADGFQALLDTNGSYNTAIGSQTLVYNLTANYNTAMGTGALYKSNADSNTATGYRALYSDTTGIRNTAIGATALYLNATGIYNTASGNEALYSSNGNFNTGTGHRALYSDTTGGQNTATGANALYFNTAGNNNAADGTQALYNCTGSSNTGLGYRGGYNLTTGSNNIDIANVGVAGESNKIRVGTQGSHNGTYIAGIYGSTAASGIAVFVDSTGHLGTTTSSARFKEGIKPMRNASEDILSLQPVTFRYKSELDPAGIPQFGLVAEEVAKVNPDLVVHDEQGEPYSVRYEAVNAMLLNEFLKEHRKVETQAKINQNQEAAIAQLKSALQQRQKEFQTTLMEERKEIQALAVALKRQAVQIQKVAGLKRIKPAVSASEMIADN